MVQTIQPYVYVEPPEIEERPFGLFGAARPMLGVDGHWMYGGVEYEGLGCYQAGFYPVGINSAGGAGGTKTLPNGRGTTKAIPFAVYAGVSCGVIGHTSEEVKARALRVLELAGQKSVENALWTGAGANKPALNGAADADHVTVSGTASSIVTALARLEDWLGDNYNGRGFIHAKRGISTYAGSRQLVRHDELDPAVVTTPGGTRWIFGAGYDGTGPGAAAPTATQQWIYATGQVSIIRGEPSAPASRDIALNRNLNVVNLIAEQEYLVTFDCVVGAALVDLTL